MGMRGGLQFLDGGENGEGGAVNTIHTKALFEGDQRLHPAVLPSHPTTPLQVTGRGRTSRLTRGGHQRLQRPRQPLPLPSL